MSVSEAIAQGLRAGIAFVIFSWILGIGVIIGLAALITWVVKKVWHAGENKHKDKPRNSYKSNDWLTNAMQRENQRFEASRPAKAKPEKTWYPTGWTWNDETKKWEPPDYLIDECHSRWRWDDKKKIWVDKRQEQRMERYKKFHEDREPTYEEWKAAKQAEQEKSPEK